MSGPGRFGVKAVPPEADRPLPTRFVLSILSLAFESCLEILSLATKKSLGGRIGHVLSIVKVLVLRVAWKF